MAAEKKDRGAKEPGKKPEVVYASHFNKIIENLREAIVIMDDEYRVLSINRAYTNMSGHDMESVRGKTASFIAAIKGNDVLFQSMESRLQDSGHWEGELWDKRRDGGEYAQRLSISAIHEKGDAFAQYIAIISDLSSKVRENEELVYQASYDSLTGLPNRSLFHDRLVQSLAVMARNTKKLSLMFIDLDGFKLVNDTLGHDVGDQLLKEAGQRLMDCVRSGDTVARLGGDEFTIIMPNIADARDSSLVAERVLHSLAEPFELGGHEAFVSGSIGITVYPDDADDANSLLRNADAAMYRAKDLGKANYQFFTSELNEEARDKLEVKNGLMKAIERNEFYLCYQPKQNIRTGEITGVEALLRWESEDLGVVSPDRFIPALDESSFALDVCELVVKNACQELEAWRSLGLKDIRVAVNLSSRQLREPKVVKIIKYILRETNTPPENFEIEIQEAMLTKDQKRVAQTLEKLHGMGIRITIDDFGAGYSSLMHLKQFPIDSIKIDRSFISGIANSPDDADIARAIITMGKTLKRDVVAVGVEDEEQLSLLHAYGCDEAQGYYLSAPTQPEDLIELLKEKSKVSDA